MPESMWHCYECNAEMRPLMMPDPHCASCNSTFVEMASLIEHPDSEDDPRRFNVGHAHPFHDHDHDHAHDDSDDFNPFAPGPQSPDVAFELFQMLMGGPGARGGGTPGGNTIRIDRRTNADVPDSTGGFRLGGGPTTRSGGPGFVFTMGGGMGGDAPMRPFFTYGSGRPDRDTDAPPAPMQGGFLRHILASVFGGAPMGDNGQFGDYVLNNEALDQIISNLMEQSNGNRPVPAPEDMVDKLPRIVVTPGSPLLSKECAVCKEDFSLTDALPPDSTSDSSSSTSQPTSSDATETQPSVVVTLPCPGAHAFHEDCILPWLKSSGTCPVCRYELVPQPKHQGPPGGPNEGGSDTVPNAGVRANSEAPQRLPGAWEDLD